MAETQQLVLPVPEHGGAADAQPQGFPTQPGMKTKQESQHPTPPSTRF